MTLTLRRPSPIKAVVTKYGKLSYWSPKYYVVIRFPISWNEKYSRPALFPIIGCPFNVSVVFVTGFFIRTPVPCDHKDWCKVSFTTREQLPGTNYIHSMLLFVTGTYVIRANSLSKCLQQNVPNLLPKKQGNLCVFYRNILFICQTMNDWAINTFHVIFHWDKWKVHFLFIC